MKKIFFIALMSLISQPLIAQDLLKFDNGEILNVNILMVYPKKLTYTIWGDTSNTVYEVTKKGLAYHRYDPQKIFKRPISFGFSAGVSLLGPATQLMSINRKNGFERTVRSWFGGEKSYPYKVASPPLAFEFERLISPNKGWGFILDIGSIGYVEGGPDIHFSRFIFTPTYSMYNRSQMTRLSIGPSIQYADFRHIESGKVLLSQDVIRFGVNIHGSAAFHEREKDFVRLFASLNIPIQNVKIGPYHSTSSTNPRELIPQTRIWLQYFAIGLQMGIRK